MCEFGLPFASFIGSLYVCVMDARALDELAYTQGLNVTAVDTGLLVTAVASPWILVPCVVFFTSAVLQNRAVDPLVAISVVVSGGHIVATPDSAMSVCAVIAALTAVSLRIWVMTDTDPPAVPVPADATEVSVDEL